MLIGVNARSKDRHSSSRDRNSSHNVDLLILCSEAVVQLAVGSLGRDIHGRSTPNAKGKDVAGEILFGYRTYSATTNNESARTCWAQFTWLPFIIKFIAALYLIHSLQ